MKWIGTFASILGSFVVAFQGFILGYILFLIGSISWLIVGIKTNDKAMILLNLAFLTANIIGLWGNI